MVEFFPAIFNLHLLLGNLFIKKSVIEYKILVNLRKIGKSTL